MTEVGFYHLTTASLEKVLPKLLEKIIAQQERALVLTSSPARMEALSYALWTYSPLSFLPHGSAKEGHAPDQPIWLTTTEERPNGASFLVLTEGMEVSSLTPYQRCLYLFDGHDPDALEKARAFWRTCQKQNHQLTYWQQTAQGTWEKQAESHSKPLEAE